MEGGRKSHGRVDKNEWLTPLVLGIRLVKKKGKISGVWDNMERAQRDRLADLNHFPFNYWLLDFSNIFLVANNILLCLIV